MPWLQVMRQLSNSKRCVVVAVGSGFTETLFAKLECIL